MSLRTSSAGVPPPRNQLRGYTAVNRRAPDWLLGLLLLTGVFLWQRTAFPAWMVDLFHLQYAAYEYRIGETEWM
jgi:hypothetical protein